jgi:hypothetical protein
LGEIHSSSGLNTTTMLLLSLLQFLCCKLSEIDSLVLKVISQSDECWDSVEKCGGITKLNSFRPTKDIDTILDLDLFMEMDIIDVSVTIACCFG